MTIGVTRDLADVDPAPSVVTIGVFDGVHRGHRALLDLVVRRARDQAARAVAVTFDRHPLQVVAPQEAPCMLQPLDRRLEALTRSGVDLVHVLTFDVHASQESADDFAARVLGGPLQAVEVVIGRNFRFGRGAAGDVARLARRGAQLGFEVQPIDLVAHGGDQVSSTAIRAAVSAGDVVLARTLRGVAHSITGVVEPGEGRGRSIGVPTANVRVQAGSCIPANGVYATRTSVRGVRHASVTNIGTRPTFAGRGRTVESHLLDADLDLYGMRVDVEFAGRLRGERRFDGVDALVEQIGRDIADARRLLPSD